MDVAELMAGQQAAGTGWNKLGTTLGQAFAGDSNKAYDEELGKQSDLATKLATARIKRDEAMQREQVQEQLSGALGDPQAAAVLSTVMRAGFGNFDQAVGGYNKIPEGVARRGALEAAMAGDGSKANLLLAVAGGKPLELRDIKDGTEFSPYQTGPNAVATAPTAVGNAEIERKQAAAGLDRTKTAAGGFAPSKPGSPDKSAAHDLKAAARDAYYSARQDGEDLKGITPGDIEYAFTHGGKWTSPGGRTTTYTVLSDADVTDAMGGGGGGPGEPGMPAGGWSPTNTGKTLAGKQAWEQAHAAAGGGKAKAVPTSTPLPPAALAKLKIGKQTTFGNGQVWTLTQDGNPSRIK